MCGSSSGDGCSFRSLLGGLLWWEVGRDAVCGKLAFQTISTGLMGGRGIKEEEGIQREQSRGKLAFQTISTGLREDASGNMVQREQQEEASRAF